MAKLYFHYATMNAGKSAYLLQANHNYTSQGMRTLLIGSAIDTRSGAGHITSRIGLTATCAVAGPETCLFEVVRADIAAAEAEGNPLRCVFVDEAQFLSEAQIVQLARVVDNLGVPVMAYGLRTDFMGRLFTGSDALMRLADEIREVRAVCWCGKRATMVLRTGPDGQVVREGVSVAVGGNDMYASVCRAHWFAGRARP